MVVEEGTAVVVEWHVQEPTVKALEWPVVGVPGR